MAAEKARDGRESLGRPGALREDVSLESGISKAEIFHERIFHVFTPAVGSRVRLCLDR